MSSEAPTPSQEARASESEVKTERRIDVKKLLTVVPPPAMLFAEKAKPKQLHEKRIRLRYSNDVSPEEAKICSKLAKELGIENALEITVAGKKRFRFRAVIDDSVPYDYVYVNPDLMKQHGVADNSMCTIRRASL